MSKTKTKQKASASGLVTNSAVAPALVANQLQRFTWNLSTKLVRNDTMEGKTYTVVPMVMMVEGVHEGSNGPLYYPAEELGKTPEVWNHKPVVVYHPSKDGKGISACTPETLTTHKIGVIMNTQFDDMGRLKAEAWLEEERVKAVDVRVWNAIEKKKPLELSTGLFTDNEVVEGEFDGEAYKAIARNYRPDHLAVLPDQIGACSMADGAGFIRNELAAQYPTMDAADIETVRDRVIKVLAAEKRKTGAIKKLLTNESSHETVRSMLQSALASKYPNKKTDICYGPWIEAVYDDFFIYCQDGKLFKLKYSATDTEVKLDGEPSEVVRVTEYRTASGSFVGNTGASRNINQNKVKDNAMDKKQIVDGLIANHGYKADDREWLMGLDEAALQRLHTASETVTANAKKAPAPVAAAPAAAQAKQTAETVLNADQQQALAYGQRMLTENKAKLIATITANKANKFSAETLSAKSIEDLEFIAALAVNAAPAQEQAPSSDFSGLGSATPIVDNAKPEDALVSPSLDFSKK